MAAPKHKAHPNSNKAAKGPKPRRPVSLPPPPTSRATPSKKVTTRDVAEEFALDFIPDPRDLSPAASKQRRAIALAAYKEFGTVAAACRCAGVGRRAWYWWLEHHPDFAKAYEDAIEDYTDDLEEVAHERAKDKSDLLMIFMLKARRRDKFGENGSSGGSNEDEKREAAAQVRESLRVKLTQISKRIHGEVVEDPDGEDQPDFETVADGEVEDPKEQDGVRKSVRKK